MPARDETYDNASKYDRGECETARTAWMASVDKAYPSPAFNAGWDAALRSAARERVPLEIVAALSDVLDSCRSWLGAEPDLLVAKAPVDRAHAALARFKSDHEGHESLMFVADRGGSFREARPMNDEELDSIEKRLAESTDPRWHTTYDSWLWKTGQWFSTMARRDIAVLVAEVRRSREPAAASGNTQEEQQ